jgi:hypothetical protein
MTVALALAAQDQHPALPLTITQAWIESRGGLHPGEGFPRIEVLNTGQRTILAWGVRYVLKSPDGRPVGNSGFGTDSASSVPEDRTISLAPGRTVHNSGGGAVVPADAQFSDVTVTFVIFDDDTALGDEREIARHFAQRRTQQAFWQKMQTIFNEVTADETDPSAVLEGIRRSMEADTDPKFREGIYYNEILARMSARRMELSQGTPDGVLKNLRTLITARKANADAHANRR